MNLPSALNEAHRAAVELDKASSLLRDLRASERASEADLEAAETRVAIAETRSREADRRLAEMRLSQLQK